MKKILIITLVLITRQAIAQSTLPRDPTSHAIDSSSVISVEGYKKLQLFSNAKEWFAKNFISSNNVIQMSDAESGKIIGKGYTLFDGEDKGSFAADCRLWFTVSITVKDDRYKFELTDFQVQVKPSYDRVSVESLIAIASAKTKFYTGLALDSEIAIDKIFKNTIPSLKATMTKKDEF